MGYFKLGHKLVKAVLKNKIKPITIKPGTKFPGQKTVKEHKKKISDIKSEAIGKKYRDELKAAGAKLTNTVNQTATNLGKLNETLRKQKKILDIK